MDRKSKLSIMQKTEIFFLIQQNANILMSQELFMHEYEIKLHKNSRNKFSTEAFYDKTIKNYNRMCAREATKTKYCKPNILNSESKEMCFFNNCIYSLLLICFLTTFLPLPCSFHNEKC